MRENYWNQAETPVTCGNKSIPLYTDSETMSLTHLHRGKICEKAPNITEQHRKACDRKR